jgi:hypothetical protein
MRKAKNLANSIPLTEALPHEIVARTVYQIILADYRSNPDCYDNATTRLLDLALQWRSLGLELIADSLQQAALHCADGNTIASWRTLQTAQARQYTNGHARR